MKQYSISEKRLNSFMSNYMDSFLETKDVTNFDSFIIVSERVAGEEEWPEFMEYDFSDGRLWVNKVVLENLMNFFSRDEKQIKDFISNWFSNKFYVEISHVE